MANEYISVVGIGCVLFLLGGAAAVFSRRIQTGGDSRDEAEADPSTMASGLA
jgi:hypothetical protein